MVFNGDTVYRGRSGYGWYLMDTVYRGRSGYWWYLMDIVYGGRSGYRWYLMEIQCMEVGVVTDGI